MLYSKDKQRIYTNPKSLRRDFPVVFAELPADGIPNFGVLPLTETLPDYDATTHKLVANPITDVLDADNNVVGHERTYTVTELTQVELDFLAEQAAQAVQRQSDKIRQRRDNLLTACDWTQVVDSPLSDTQKADWATYRQALRDITSQTGFPDNVVWPVAP